MAISKFANRVWETTPTTGTGSSITLSGAVDDLHFTFAEAGVQNGDTVSYIIIDGTDVELQREQTYSVSGSTRTLSRAETPHASKISGTAGTSQINLSGSATVLLVPFAEDFDFREKLAESSTDNAIARFDGTSGKLQNSKVLISDDGTLVIAPTPKSTARGIDITVSGPTSGSAGSNLFFNRILANATDVDCEGGDVVGLEVRMGTGGENADGQRISIVGYTVQNSATGSEDIHRIVYCGISGIGQGSVNDGGTDTDGPPNSIGYVLGINAVGILDSNATNYLHLAGLEVLTTMREGASAANHVGMRIVQYFDHAESGSLLDAGLQFINQTGAVGWKHYGIVFDADSADAGTLFQSDATLIGTKGPMTLKSGVDLRSATFSQYAFRSNGFTVNGFGDVAVGNVGSYRGRIFFAGPTSGQVVLQAADVASGELTLPSTTGRLVAHVQTFLADDAAMSVAPPAETGMLVVVAQGNAGGVFMYSTSTPSMEAIAGPGSGGAAVTGALSGTTGEDGKFTVSAHTDGKIYFENRLGFTRTFTYMFLTA